MEPCIFHRSGSIDRNRNRIEHRRHSPRQTQLSITITVITIANRWWVPVRAGIINHSLLLPSFLFDLVWSITTGGVWHNSVIRVVMIMRTTTVMGRSQDVSNRMRRRELVWLSMTMMMWMIMIMIKTRKDYPIIPIPQKIIGAGAVALATTAVAGVGTKKEKPSPATTTTRIQIRRRSTVKTRIVANAHKQVETTKKQSRIHDPVPPSVVDNRRSRTTIPTIDDSDTAPVLPTTTRSTTMWY